MPRKSTGIVYFILFHRPRSSFYVAGIYRYSSISANISVMAFKSTIKVVPTFCLYLRKNFWIPGSRAFFCPPLLSKESCCELDLSFSECEVFTDVVAVCCSTIILLASNCCYCRSISIARSRLSVERISSFPTNFFSARLYSSSKCCCPSAPKTDASSCCCACAHASKYSSFVIGRLPLRS